MNASNNDLDVYSTTNEELALRVRACLNRWTFGANFYVSRRQYHKEPFVVALVSGRMRTENVQNTVVDFAYGIAFALQNLEHLDD